MTKKKWNWGGYTMWMMGKRQCTWTKLWSLIEGGWGGFKRKKWEKWQKGVEIYVFPFRMNMGKIRIVLRNGPKGNLTATQRENWKLISHDHAKISHNHVKCSRKAKLVLMHFPLRTIVWNCWSLCEITFFQISWWRSLWKTSWMMPSVHLNLTYK